jgi:hypothetical protein
MVHKTIIYSFITLILIINTIIIYILNQTTQILENYDLMIKLFGTIFILLISNIIIFQSNISQRALHKKNFLKLNFIIIIILLISSIIQRIQDYKLESLISLTIIQTILYTILLITTIMLLIDLRDLIKKLFHKNKN